MGQNLIVAKNIKTGETLEFASQKEVADYLTDVYGKKIYISSVAAIIKQDVPYKKTWEINYIKENSNVKVCECCKKEYKTNRKKQRFCSFECRENYYNAQRVAKNPKTSRCKIRKKKEKELIHKLYVMLTPYRTKEAKEDA